MNYTFIVIALIALGIIISGILLLKQSATKFHLTDEQRKKIDERNKQLAEEEKQEDY